jgi:hypothetical protein
MPEREIVAVNYRTGANLNTVCKQNVELMYFKTDGTKFTLGFKGLQ